MDPTEYLHLYNYLKKKEYPTDYNSNDKRTLRKKTEHFIEKDGKIYYKMHSKDDGIENLRLVIPKEEKTCILSSCHIISGSHLGIDKTTAKVNERYYWKGIVKDVREFVKICDQCQKTNKKTKTTVPEMESIAVPPSTWKKIAIDLIGPYNDESGKPLSKSGYRYVLTVIDFFCNYTEAFPLFTKRASEIAEKLYILFCRHGVPLELISDNGGEFTTGLSTLLDDKYGYRHITISPYNPQANGKCERANQTLKNSLSKIVDSQSDCWELFLPKCLFSYNTSKHASTKFSPFCLMYWRNPVLPNEQSLGDTCNTFQKYKQLTEEEINKCADRMFEIQEHISSVTMDNVTDAQKRQKMYFDKRHDVGRNEFKEGGKVLVKNRKRKKGMTKQNWLGPYIIDKIVKNRTYRLINATDNCVIGTYKQMNVKIYNDEPEIELEVSAQVHNVNTTFTDTVDDKSDTSDEVNDANDNPIYDQSIFLSQNIYKDTDEIEILEAGIVERPKRRCRDKKRQSSIYEYFGK